MLNDSGSLHRLGRCDGRREGKGSVKAAARTRGRFGLLLALAILPSAECGAATPTLPDVPRSATPPFVTLDPDWWNALQHLSDQWEAERLRAVLAPAQWIALPVTQRGGARKGGR